MKPLALIVNKKNILLSKYAKDGLEIARKHFSTSNTFSKKSTANPVPAPRVIIPGSCRSSKPPISTPQCKVAVVIGGSNSGYGYFAAEQLLRHGAKRVVLADDVDESVGESACERLCKAYGKDRAKFYPCDVRNSCQIEGIFTSSYCRDEKIGILFNDLDAVQSLPEHSRLNNCKDSIKISNTQRLTRLGLELMQQQRRHGIIVNCASILGFMGWPLADEAVPVYCAAEPVLETTIRMARSFPVEETSARLVCLCPANRVLDSIGLPDLPTENESCEGRTSCAPDPSKDRSRIGRALVHVMARAETGSFWILEPPYTLRETPRLVPLASSVRLQEEDCPTSIKAPSNRHQPSENCSVDCKSTKLQKCS